MTPADMAALHARCFTRPRPWSESEFRDMASLPGAFLLTCPTGFLMGRTVADEAELLTLAVDPAARRAGTGRALVTRFAAGARTRAATRAFLEVASDNPAALALYESTGWRATGRRRGYYGAGVDAITMALDLTSGRGADPAQGH